jgi:DNA-binding beta-propeller fold protein YncE
MKVLTTGILFLVLCAFAQGQTTNQLLTLDKTISLPGVEGRIDHMAVDVAGQRLFVAALQNNTVEVLDLKTGQLIQSISGLGEPQGLVYVPEFDKLFVANGSDGTCRILDGHSFKTLNSLDLGDDADNVRYDAAAKKVYVGYGSGGLAAIDAKTGEKTGDIPLPAHPESFRMNMGSPDVYVNVPEAGQIAVVDRVEGKVVDTWPLKDARENFPMVLDEANKRMFVGCRKPAAVLVYNYHGRLLQNIPIGADTDDLFYDARNKLVYASCGAGSVAIIRQIDVDNYQEAKRVVTMPNARTSLFIPELNLLCVAVPEQNKGEPARVLVYRTP